MNIKSFLQSVWDVAARQGYLTVGIANAQINYADGDKGHIVYEFQENPKGKRRVLTITSAPWLNPKSHGFYLNGVKPWLAGAKETFEVISSIVPDAYIRLGYKFLGDITHYTTFTLKNGKEKEPCVVSYFFYENDAGNRRIICECLERQGIHISETTNLCRQWIQGRIEIGDIPHLNPPSNGKKSSSERVISREGKLIVGDFGADRPEPQ